MSKYLLGNGELVKWKNGDFDNDDHIDMFDLVLMRKHMIANS